MARTTLIGLAFVVLAGCGCVEDSGEVLSFNPTTLASFTVETAYPPIPVAPPPPGPRKIDILFVLDDSATFVTQNLSGDASVLTKSLRVQRIFRDVYQVLASDLAVALPGEQLDLAYGVGRYEDFGGTFRSVTDDDDKPWVLQQPILRTAHPDFVASIEAALTASLPGDGNPPAKGADAETAIEALYQAATGAGLDADDNGSFADAAAGDVPPVTAAEFVADPAHPGEFLRNGLPASGTEGGAGWRPGSMRFVIIASDIATVGPFPMGTPEPIPAGPVGPKIANTPGDCRPAAEFFAVAFASFEHTAQTPQRNNRFGALPAPVGPVNAHTIQEAIDALNGSGPLGIEVLSIGTPPPVVVPNPSKPNQPAPEPVGNQPAITDPSVPDKGPFTWMSAVGYLTGATTMAEPAEPQVLLPLVYNIRQVFGPSLAAPTADVREDLVERIQTCLAFIPQGNVNRPPLAPFTTDVTFSMPLAGAPFFTYTAFEALAPVPGAGNLVAGSQTQVGVTVPRYYSDEVAPAGTTVRWRVTIQRTDPNDNVDRQATLPFTITPSPGSPPQVTQATGDVTVHLSQQPDGGPTIFSTVTLENTVTGRPVTVDQVSDQDTPPQTDNP